MEKLVNPSPAFWSGRKVLVTGHTGFKGSWLSLWLKELGAQVTGFALSPPSSPSLFDLTGGAGVDQDVRGDIRDLDAIGQCVESCTPEIVFHLAAQSLVRASFRDPLGTLATNVMGTAHLFEALRRTAQTRAIVNVTSDKCYEPRTTGKPYSETDPLGGGDPYSASKACAEIVTAAWRHSFFQDEGTPRIASVRAGNVIGGGDWAVDRLIPDCIRAWEKGQVLSIRYPQAVRPWQHVLEPLSGYLLVAERLFSSGGEVAEPWNFGPDGKDEWPVSDVVAAMARRWGNAAAWRIDAGVHPPEAALLKLSTDKARIRLGWQPRLDLAEALDWTVDWYRQQSNGGGVEALCLKQIGDYERKAVSQ